MTALMQSFLTLAALGIPLGIAWEWFDRQFRPGRAPMWEEDRDD